MKTLMALKTCVVAAVAAMGLAGRVAQGATCTYTDGAWDNEPAGEEDAIVVASGELTWSAALPHKVASWTQAGGDVTFETTYATEGDGAFPFFEVTGDVAISGGTWTHPKQPGDKEIYRLNVKVEGDFELGEGAAVDVQGRGFGPGVGIVAVANEVGGTYGGASKRTDGKCYGSIKSPVDIGGSSRSWSSEGDNYAYSGGCFILACTGTATINGAVNADGEDSAKRAPGGGSAWITAATITGSGSVTARGASGKSALHSPGAGGRISLVQTAQGATYENFPMSQVSAVNGNSWSGGKIAVDNNRSAGCGTIYYEVPSDGGRGTLLLRASGGTNFRYDGGMTELNPTMTQEFNFRSIIIEKGAQLSVYNIAFDVQNTEIKGDGTGAIVFFGTGTLVTPDEFTLAGVTLYPVATAANIYGAASTELTNAAKIVYQQASTCPGDLVVNADCQLSARGGTSYFIDLSVGGDLDFREGAVLDVTGCGGVTTGKPAVNNKENGSSHGGRGSLFASGTTVTKELYAAQYAAGQVGACYGNVREPWEYGSSGYAGSGGGKARVTVAGATHLNGKWYATGNGGDSRADSGGSLILTTGTIDGAGYMQVKGGKTNGRLALGGAGRIAVTLTEPGATFDNFTGNFGAYGTDGTVSTSDSSHKDVLPNKSRTTLAGAGTVYLRAGGEEIDEGAAIVDNCRDDGKVNWEMSITEFNTAMPDLDFGKVVVRRGGQLVLMPGVEVETSVWSNGCKVVCDPTSTVKIKGDRNGEAWIFGDTVFGNLTILPSVTTLHVAAESSNSVATAFTARGTANEDGKRIRFRSTEDGVRYALDISVSASQDLEFLDVRDADATGAKLAPQNSVDGGNNNDNWTFDTIEPGMAITWTGAESSAWGLAENWLDAEGTARAPIATDRVTVPAGAANMPEMPTAAVTVMDLTVASGASLALNGATLTVTGDAAIRGALFASGTESVTFGGGVDFAKDSFAAANTTVTIANAGETAKVVNFAGSQLNRLVFANVSEVDVTGGFTAAELAFEAGAKVSFAQDAACVATTMGIAGTAGTPVELAPTVADGTYALTVKGYATVAGAKVGGADSSAGMAIYATDSEFTDGNVRNWHLGDTRYAWTGEASSDFANAANWLVEGVIPETAPGEGDDVIVAGGKNTMTISTEGVSIRSLTVSAGAVKFSKPAAIGGSMVLLSGTTATVDQPLEIGDSFLMFSGSTLTHSGQGGGTLKYWIELNVGGNAVIEEGATVAIADKGYANGTGPGHKVVVTDNCGASYGGQGAGPGTTTNGWCYGSIFCVTNCGSGGYNDGREGGGLFILHADSGLVTFDGTVNASRAWVDNHSGSGGGVWITAGRIRGKGEINCDGGHSNNANNGGGGRISIVLREPGATFDDFQNAKVHAYGGMHGYDGGRSGGAGTIYLQTGDQPDGYGTIRVENHVTMNYNAHTILGYEGCDDLRHATIEIGQNGWVGIWNAATEGAPLKIGDIKFTSTTAKLNLFGNVLRVDRPWHEYPTGQVENAGSLNEGKKPNWSNIRWKASGIALIVR